MDALHTQRDLAQRILAQRGHYLMIVKENQPTLYQMIALLFEQPPWLKQEQAGEYQVYAGSNKGEYTHDEILFQVNMHLKQYCFRCII